MGLPQNVEWSTYKCELCDPERYLEQYDRLQTLAREESLLKAVKPRQRNMGRLSMTCYMSAALQLALSLPEVQVVVSGTFEYLLTGRDPKDIPGGGADESHLESKLSSMFSTMKTLSQELCKTGNRTSRAHTRGLLDSSKALQPHWDDIPDNASEYYLFLIEFLIAISDRSPRTSLVSDGRTAKQVFDGRLRLRAENADQPLELEKDITVSLETWKLCGNSCELAEKHTVHIVIELECSGCGTIVRKFEHERRIWVTIPATFETGSTLSLSDLKDSYFDQLLEYKGICDHCNNMPEDLQTARRENSGKWTKRSARIVKAPEILVVEVDRLTENGQLRHNRIRDQDTFDLKPWQPELKLPSLQDQNDFCLEGSTTYERIGIAAYIGNFAHWVAVVQEGSKHAGHWTYYDDTHELPTIRAQDLSKDQKFCEGLIISRKVAEKTDADKNIVPNDASSAPKVNDLLHPDFDGVGFLVDLGQPDPVPSSSAELELALLGEKSEANLLEADDISMASVTDQPLPENSVDLAFEQALKALSAAQQASKAERQKSAKAEREAFGDGLAMGLSHAPADLRTKEKDLAAREEALSSREQAAIEKEAELASREESLLNVKQQLVEILVGSPDSTTDARSLPDENFYGVLSQVIKLANLGKYLFDQGGLEVRDDISLESIIEAYIAKTTKGTTDPHLPTLGTESLSQSQQQASSVAGAASTLPHTPKTAIRLPKISLPPTTPSLSPFTEEPSSSPLTSREKVEDESLKRRSSTLKFAGGKLSKAKRSRSRGLESSTPGGNLGFENDLPWIRAESPPPSDTITPTMTLRGTTGESLQKPLPALPQALGETAESSAPAWATELFGNVSATPPQSTEADMPPPAQLQPPRTNVGTSGGQDLSRTPSVRRLRRYGSSESFREPTKASAAKEKNRSSRSRSPVKTSQSVRLPRPTLVPRTPPPVPERDPVSTGRSFLERFTFKTPGPKAWKGRTQASPEQSGITRAGHSARHDA